MPGIYQVRGMDLSNISFIEGDSGVIYAHSHVDHFGGVKGVTTQADVDAGKCVIIAPEGFLEHAVSENVCAGRDLTG